MLNVVKWCFSLFLMGGLYSSLTAQAVYKPTPERPTFFVGGSAGTNASLMLYQPSVGQQPVMGGHAGATIQLENSSYTGVSLSLHYMFRGHSEAYGTRSPEKGYTRQLHYLEMPLHFSLFVPLGRFRVGLRMGPQIGVQIGEKKLIRPAEYSEPELIRQALASRKFAWGISAGPYLAVDWSRHRIEMYAKGYFGLGDLYSTHIGAPFSRANEVYVAAGFSYLFCLLR